MRREEERPFRAELGELRVEELGSRLVERAVRLVENEQLRLVEEDAAKGEPREYDATRSCRASQSPKRSSSMPIRSRRSTTR